ncbi:hypothetical protein [Christiangramia flava]|uniref:hypothetical protein n=1 Tax=Christiangramia flava TaxID=1486245 RepID=UPI00111BE489|nr:hypothetical protein [Christiangramia flava]
MDYEPKTKNEYLEKNKNNLEILILGASQTERAINPEFLDFNSINLAASSQGIYPNFCLFKYFAPKLPKLKIVVLGMPFNAPNTPKEYTSPIVNHLNLAFYNVNTFGRATMPQDYLLFHSNQDYFSSRIQNYFRDGNYSNLNKFGYDTTRFYGAYQAANYNIGKINKSEIHIENEHNSKAIHNNARYLKKIIRSCKERNIKVVLYSSPTHFLYNEMRDTNLVYERDSLVKNLMEEYENLYFFNDEDNSGFEADLFYNANHLNPIGAKKASSNLKTFISKIIDNPKSF